MQNIKLVVVGDSTVGKTCLLIAYEIGTYPGEYIPSQLDNETVNIMVDGKPISLALWDTPGEEYGCDRLRPLSYPQTDVLLVCFSITDKSSLNRAKSNWIPEIQHYVPEVPFILVGNKSDLRNDQNMIDELAEKGLNFVTEEEAQTIAKEVGAVKYCECSALTQEGLKYIFDEAVRAVIWANEKSKKRSITNFF